MNSLAKTLIALLVSHQAYASSVVAWKSRLENINDITSNGYMSGTYTFPSGKFGKAMLFGANTDGAAFFNTPATYSPFNNGEITISMWIYPLNTDVYVFAIGSETTTYCMPVSLRIDSSGYLNTKFCEAGVGCQPSSMSSPIPMGVWSHYAMTFKSGNIVIYLNGRMQNAIFGTGLNMTPAAFVRNLQLGSNAFTAQGSSHCEGLASTYYQGAFDEIGIYNKALTEAEIRQLMLNYTPRGG